MSYSTPERPLADVLHHVPGLDNFDPEHPERPPWHQHPSLPPSELVSTGNLVELNLMAATRVSLTGLDRLLPSWDRDPLEPFTDWKRGPGWGVPPA
jgi:hypothetical protein